MSEVISHPDLPFSIESDLNGRLVSRNALGFVEAATLSDYLLAKLYVKLIKGEPVGYEVSEHSQQIAALKAELAQAYARIAELEKQPCNVAPRDLDDSESEAEEETEKPAAKRSRK